MLIAPPHPQEVRRLRELRNLLILDSEPEAMFDRLVAVACALAQTRIGQISLADQHRQWCKSRWGLDTQEISRDVAFCSHTILQSEPLIVEDARQDPRFADNPLVVGDPLIRFYAGFPLISRTGLPLGSLCVMDREPRRLGAALIRQLQALAAEIVVLFELRRRNLVLEASQLTGACLELVVDQDGTIVMAHGSLEGLACATSAWEGRPLLEQLPLEADVVERLCQRDPRRSLSLATSLSLQPPTGAGPRPYRLEAVPVGQVNPVLHGLCLIRLREPTAEEISLEKRRQFLQLLTHEVNTPLAIVRGNLHRLHNRNPHDPLIEAAREETRRMTRLFDRLVVLARLDELIQFQSLDRCNPCNLAQQWLDQSAPEIRQRVSLQHGGCLPCEHLQVLVETQAFRILLGELVDNALRFSEPGTAVGVVIGALETSDHVDLVVIDRGPGLDSAILEAGFEAFRKSEHGRRADRAEGSGLGLHLVATVLSRLKGSLQIHRISAGTAVRVRLPREGAEAGNPEPCTQLAPCDRLLALELGDLLGAGDR